MFKQWSQSGNSMFWKDIRASVFNEKTKFNKQWIDLMPYYFVFLLLGNMNVF